MSWWITRADRALEELKGLHDLACASDWFSVPSAPRFVEGLNLAQDFDICWMEKTYPLTLIFPEFFPDVPARVVHRDGKRISIHQYGATGELCLRHRAENWSDSVTGRSLVEDAFALISGEHPSDGSTGHVPSGDLLTQGQQHAGAFARFVVPSGIADRVPPLDQYETRPIQLFTSFHEGNNFVLRIASFEKDSDGHWVPLSRSLPGDYERKGLLINLAGKVDPSTLSAEAFIENVNVLRQQAGLGVLSLSGLPNYIIDVHDPGWVAFLTLKDESAMTRYSTISGPPPADRLPATYASLGEAHVAVIGCGSIGSKVALSLARSGVRKFTLIDDDLFHEDNTERNALDLQAVGLHKVDALRFAIERLPGDYTFVCKRAGLGRQGSALSTNAYMEAIGKADLILDLTANARAFNFTAAVSTRRKIPFVGASVFAGGIGGMVFRARPDVDPTPAQAKAQIKRWKSDRGVPWETEGEVDPYTYTLDEDVMIATDADVSVMAGYATQMALDILGDAPTSAYPHSAYAIGFQEKWIFSAPFHVFPIALAADGVWGEPAAVSEVDRQANIAALEKIAELLTEKDAS